MQIAIVDDLQSDIDLLASMLADYAEENGQEYSVTRFADSQTFLCAAEPGKFEMVFLDILMDGMDGIEAARCLKERDPSALLVFVTTEAHYAVEGYEVEAAAFLVKPPDKQKFYRTMERLERKLAKDAVITINGCPTVRKILAGSLLYARVSDHYMKLHVDKEVYSPNLTLGQLCSLLPSDGRFIECSRGILVNLDHVTRIGDKFIKMDNGDNLPVSRRRRQELMNAFAARNFARIREKML